MKKVSRAALWALILTAAVATMVSAEDDEGQTDPPDLEQEEDSPWYCDWFGIGC